MNYQITVTMLEMFQIIASYYDVAIIVLDEVQWQHSVDTKKLIVFAVKGFRIQ